MSFKKRANKVLAFGLVLSLIMGSVTPVGVLANDSVTPEAEATGAIALVQSGETIKGIDLNGNSVVIQEAADVSGNAIADAVNLFYDLDMDGVVDDGESKVVVDGISEFENDINIYGAYSAYVEQDIRITLSSGTVAGIYGIYDVGVDGNVSIYLNGGTVSTVCGLYGDRSITGKLTIVVGETATVSSLKAYNSDPLCSSSYIDNQGAVQISGILTLAEDLTADTLTVGFGTVTIPEGVTVSASEINLAATSASILVKGALNVSKFTGYGRVLVAGGKLPDQYTMSTYCKKYYPVNISSSMENASITFNSSYSISITEGDLTTTYLQTNSSVKTTANVAGYDCYYSVDGGEYVASGDSGFFIKTPANGSVNLQFEYVPSQISVAKKYSSPKGYVGTTYTVEDPLCDLTIYPITGDTTEEYGGEVKYGLKRGSSLPAGLSLKNGKIIGTPTTADEEGKIVTVVVTGRNGSTANLELTIKILDNSEGQKNINDLVAVDTTGKVIDLQGTSVVVLADDSTTINLLDAQIFLDQDHDTLPDNNIPLMIGDMSSYELTDYTIYGYRISEPVEGEEQEEEIIDEGDISITIKGGSFKNVYGVYGTSSENMAQVNGDVSIYFEGGTINGASNGDMGTMCAAYYAKVDNVTLEVTGGTYNYMNFYAAHHSEVTEDVNYIFGEESSKVLSGGYCYLYVGSHTSVGRDVNVQIGYDTDLDGLFGSSYAKFYGLNQVTVTRDVHYIFDGKWNPSSTEMIRQSSSVGGNMDVDWKSGTLSQTTLVSGSEITGALTFDADEGATVKGANLYVFKSSGTAGSAWINIPVSCSDTIAVSDTSGAKTGLFSNSKGNVIVEGTYNITEDIEATKWTLGSNSDVTIEQGVTVDITQSLVTIPSGSTLTNKGVLNINQSIGVGAGIKGILKNEGKLTTTSSSGNYNVYIASGGTLINAATGEWDMAGKLDNLGKVVNYGSVVQSNNNYGYYYKLGTIYTTMPLNLYEDPTASSYTLYDSGSSKYNSIFYYAINVDYPTHCAAAPTLTGTEIVSSGVSGDTNNYIRVYRSGDGNSTFTVTPGAVSNSSFGLKNVTYGPDKTGSGVTQNGTTIWSGDTADIFEPITLTLNYYNIDNSATNITLDDEDGNDSVSNLMVGNTYTEESPLYDLTEIGIKGDMTDVEGKVLYSVKEGSTLPDGIVLKDGKLYGTLTTATAETQDVVFAVKGLNLTTAEFTLTFGAVAKAVPDWSVPTGFTAEVGMQVGDVELPADPRGEYRWEADTQALELAEPYGVRLIFTPSSSYSIDNYDWAAAAGNDWDAEKGEINCYVTIDVKPTDQYEVDLPESLTAVYGQTFADVQLPEVDGGYYEWDEEYNVPSADVGAVGVRSCYVKFIPTADKNHKTKTGIEAQLTVTAAAPVYEETLTAVEVICDGTLGDTVLPDATCGKYQWVTSTSVKPVDGASYQVIYIPEDTTNYDWTQVSGWNKLRKGVVFSIRVDLMHAWDEGVVTKPATTAATGVKTYTCGLCGATKTETIAKLPGSSGGAAAGGNAGSGALKKQPQVGYTMSDKSSKSVYKVSAVGAEVTYVKPDKKTYTKVKIPATIKYEGVTYKVTAIADNAFKNNKKLKSVTIGSNIKSIGKSAFQNCTSLKSITIPKNVEKIGAKAFYGCKKLVKMTIKTTKLTTKNVGKNAFKKMGSSNYKKVKVKVPKKKLKAYKKTLVKRGLSKKAKIKK